MTEEGTRRLGLTLDTNEYARVRAYARQVGTPVATVAKRLLLGAIDGHGAESALAAVSRERDRVRQLQDELTRLQTQLDECATPDLTAGLPRWRWPLTALLADREWWERWLPLLGELIGRSLEYDRAYGDRHGQPTVDDRGFADLMGYLFSDLTDERGARVPWHSPEYGGCARLAWDAARSTPSLQRRPVRAEVWEPVIRHIALALTALETTCQTPNDAYTHLRVEAEIRGEWMRTLCGMLGEDGAQHLHRLPRDPLP
jgi:hypothetical protein